MTQSSKGVQPRTIKGANWVGLYTLVHKEVSRFLTVYMQTIIAPAITTLLYYTIFALAFGGLSREIHGISFLQFLAPGLIVMNIIQNSFANSSSSLVIAKIQGNIVDTIMPPLSPLEILAGFISGAVLRGIAVGIATTLVLACFAPVTIVAPGKVLLFGLLGSVMLSALGVLAGIWAEKFDHIAAFTNFIVMPLTFLSGAFYAASDLPGMWQALAHYNPFFYIIDGFRAGFIGMAEADFWVGVLLLSGINLFLISMAYIWIRNGYKIKS